MSDIRKPTRLYVTMRCGANQRTATSGERMSVVSPQWTNMVYMIQTRDSRIL